MKLTREFVKEIINDYVLDSNDSYNGEKFNYLYWKKQLKSEINQAKSKEFISKVIKDYCIKNSITLNNTREVSELYSRIISNQEPYLIFANDIIKPEETFFETPSSYEFDFYTTGENLVDGLNYIYDTLKQSQSVKYNIMVDLSPDEYNTYQIGIFSSKENKDALIEIISKMDLSKYFIKFDKIFGEKVNNYVGYDVYDIDKKISMNKLVGKLLIKALKNYIIKFNNENNQNLKYETDDEIRKSILEIENTEEELFENKLNYEIEAEFKSNGINLDNIFDTTSLIEGKYLKVLKVPRASIVHEIEENLEETKTVPVFINTIADSKISDINTFENIGEGFINGVNDATTAIVDKPVNALPSEVEMQKNSEPIENVNNSINEQTDNIEYEPIDVIKPVNNMNIDNSNNKINFESIEENNEYNLENTLTYDQIEDQNIKNLAIKYKDVVNIYDAIKIIKDNKTLVQVLDDANIYNLIPLDAKIKTDDEEEMTGQIFIKTRIIPIVIKLQETNIELLIERYSQNYYEKNVKQKGKIRINSNKK